MTTILALDPARVAGYVVAGSTKPIGRMGIQKSGIVTLGKTTDDRDTKLEAWARFLDMFLPRVSYVVYEAPIHYRGRSLDTFRMACNLEGVTILRCRNFAVPCFSATPGAVKKAATGNGRSKKPVVSAAMRELWSIDFDDENIGDALAVLTWALANLDTEATK